MTSDWEIFQERDLRADVWQFIKDKKFVEILKNENKLDLISLRKQINLQFQNSFLFYKTLGLKEASFYNFKNNFILSMEDNYENNFISKITSKVVNNKKDLIDYKIDNGKLILSKTICKTMIQVTDMKKRLLIILSIVIPSLPNIQI